MLSLKEKYKKPIPIMKQIMKIKKKVAKNNSRLTSEEKRRKMEEFDKKNEEFKKQNIYFSTIINDDIIKHVLIIFNEKFDSFQWVWDHQEEVYNATIGKSRLELIDYFESIYQYIQKS